jgi:hypothetical protein
VGDTAQQELTPFEKLALLRDELEARGKELTAIDRRIHAIRDAMTRRKYLWSIYPEFYKEMPPPESAKELPAALEKKRVLETLISRLNAEIANIEMSLKSTAGPQDQQAGRQAPSGKKARFASFDQFSSPQRPQ